MRYGGTRDRRVMESGLERCQVRHDGRRGGFQRRRGREGKEDVYDGKEEKE